MEVKHNIIHFFSDFVYTVYSKLYIRITYVLMVNQTIISRVKGMIACTRLPSCMHPHTLVVMYTPSSKNLQTSNQTRVC